MEERVKQTIDDFHEYGENFIITETIEIFVKSQDDKIKLQALELLKDMY